MVSRKWFWSMAMASALAALPTRAARAQVPGDKDLGPATTSTRASSSEAGSKAGTETATVAATATATAAEGGAPEDEPIEEVEEVVTAPSGPPPSDRVEEVVVTGSRIRRRRVDADAPILDLSSEDLKDTGLTSVGDILQRLPNSGGALNTKFNASGNSGFPPDGDGIGAGAAQADLRYLGSKRVLVLVDGVRWVNGSSASGVSAATDLNTIPFGIIDRIEVLQDGASPIYGSDAIAGVINIITKKSFKGVEAEAYVGGYHKGDGLTQSYAATWGAKQDRLTTVLNLSFTRQESIRSSDRRISRFPVPYFDRCTGGCSSGTPQGRFAFRDPNTMQDVDVTLNEGVEVPVYDPANPASGDFRGFTDADRFNFAPYNYILTPNQRFGTFGQVEYKFSNAFILGAKVLFNNRTSKNQAAPEPLFIGPEAGNGNRLDRISIDATNPYNPFGFTLDAATNPYFIGRRPLEAGPRIFSQNVNTWYTSGGGRGVLLLGGRSVFWDTTAVYSQNRADQVKTGGFDSSKLERALGPLALCQADPSCVPFNIFGGQGPDGTGSITPEMLDYVTFTQKDVSEQRLVDWTANVSAELIDLPAGRLGVAVGAEYRRLSGFFLPDAIVAAGDSSDVPAQPTEGRYSALEGYGEINVPLLAELPAADLLEVSGAVRVSDYSTFGVEETFKVGARYRPFRDLMFRGAWAQGFRAPGIGELFGTEARFDQELSDPCSDLLGQNGAPATQEVRNNCAALGVPTDGSYSQFNSQISVATGGNRDLEPERSDGYTVSAVYSPASLEKTTYIDELDFEVGYYRLELEGAIRALDAQVQLDRCVRTLDPVFCSGISRTPAGTINRFSNRLTNIGGIETDGLDFTIAYASPMTRAGRFRATSLSNVLLTFTEKVPSATGFDALPRAGTEVGDPQQAYPKFKSTLLLDWGLGDWGVGLIGRYIHSVTEPCRGLSDLAGTCSNPNTTDDMLATNRLAARVYLDARVTWTPTQLDRDLTVTLGVNNALNQDPPPCYSCALNGYDASTYDVPGVFGYVRAGYRLGGG